MKAIWFQFLFLCPLTLGAQRILLSGTVSNALGKAIPSVLVEAKETLFRTTTDSVGHYTLSVPPKQQILVFSAAGYVTQQVHIAKSKRINIVLKTVPSVSPAVTAMPAPPTRNSTMPPPAKREAGIPPPPPPPPPAEMRAKTESVFSNAPLKKSKSRISADKSKSYSGSYARPMPPKARFDTTDTPRNTEDYKHIVDNPFKKAVNAPLSTFSIDVDKASYSNVRRFIREGELPPADAVRIEELINYFDYDYPQPTTRQPLEIITELGNCPWNKEHYLLHIGMKGKEYSVEQAPASNLVFLIDVSGSMNSENRLPLVIKSFEVLVGQLRKQDKVAIVVYAGAAGLVLPSTSGAEKDSILNTLKQLHAGGSTAGGAGIELAYKIAQENLLPNGNNRVILATDGDFNVGVSSTGELTRLIEEKRSTGIFLSVLGFGMGNYKDDRLESLADKGNGNYAYIDDLSEAKRVLGSEMTGTLFTIAKDVKLQIEFNPLLVGSYRLIGYENRVLQNEDFNNDAKDAGELGAGQTVTALYEIIPAGTPEPQTTTVDPLKYQQNQPTTRAQNANEWVNIKFRYKLPKQQESLLVEQSVLQKPKTWLESSLNFRFSAAVASYGMLLRGSEHKGESSYSKVLEWATAAKGADTKGYRTEFLNLVQETLNTKGK